MQNLLSPRLLCSLLLLLLGLRLLSCRFFRGLLNRLNLSLGFLHEPEPLRLRLFRLFLFLRPPARYKSANQQLNLEMILNQALESKPIQLLLRFPENALTGPVFFCLKLRMITSHNYILRLLLKGLACAEDEAVLGRRLQRLRLSCRMQTLPNRLRLA